MAKSFPQIRAALRGWENKSRGGQRETLRYAETLVSALPAHERSAATKLLEPLALAVNRAPEKLTFELGLATSGNLELHLPSGRKLEISPTAAGVSHIIRMLTEHQMSAAPAPKRIATFPTQAEVNRWSKTNPVKRLPVGASGIEPKPARKADAAPALVNLSSLSFEI